MGNTNKEMCYPDMNRKGKENDVNVLFAHVEYL